MVKRKAPEPAAEAAGEAAAGGATPAGDSAGAAKPSGEPSPTPASAPAGGPATAKAKFSNKEAPSPVTAPPAGKAKKGAAATASVSTEGGACSSTSSSAAPPPPKNKPAKGKKGGAAAGSDAAGGGGGSSSGALASSAGAAAVDASSPPAGGGITLDIMDVPYGGSSKVPPVATLSRDGLTLTGRYHRMVRATRGVSSGAWFCEWVFAPVRSAATAAAPGTSGPAVRLGWASSSAERHTPIGFDQHSYGYRSDSGSRVHQSVRSRYGRPWRSGDVIGCLIVFDTPEPLLADAEARTDAGASAGYMDGARARAAYALAHDDLLPVAGSSSSSSDGNRSSSAATSMQVDGDEATSDSNGTGAAATASSKRCAACATQLADFVGIGGQPASKLMPLTTVAASAQAADDGDDSATAARSRLASPPGLPALHPPLQRAAVEHTLFHSRAPPQPLPWSAGDVGGGRPWANSSSSMATPRCDHIADALAAVGAVVRPRDATASAADASSAAAVRDAAGAAGAAGSAAASSATAGKAGGTSAAPVAASAAASGGAGSSSGRMAPRKAQPGLEQLGLDWDPRTGAATTPAPSAPYNHKRLVNHRYWRSSVRFFVNGADQGTAFIHLTDDTGGSGPSHGAAAETAAAAASAAFGGADGDDAFLLPPHPPKRCAYFPAASVYGGASVRFNPGPVFKYPPPAPYVVTAGPPQPPQTAAGADAGAQAPGGAGGPACTIHWRPFADAPPEDDDAAGLVRAGGVPGLLGGGGGKGGVDGFLGGAGTGAGGLLGGGGAGDKKHHHTGDPLAELLRSLGSGGGSTGSGSGVRADTMYGMRMVTIAEGGTLIHAPDKVGAFSESAGYTSAAAAAAAGVLPAPAPAPRASVGSGGGAKKKKPAAAAAAAAAAPPPAAAAAAPASAPAAPSTTASSSSASTTTAALAAAPPAPAADTAPPVAAASPAPALPTGTAPGRTGAQSQSP